MNVILTAAESFDCRIIFTAAESFQSLGIWFSCLVDAGDIINGVR
jgi:hypothetical protein